MINYSDKDANDTNFSNAVDHRIAPEDEPNEEHIDEAYSKKKKVHKRRSHVWKFFDPNEKSND